jgi:hypothetical protein
MRRTFAAVIFCFLGFLSPYGLCAEIINYNFTTIDFPGGTDTELHDINNSGQIVGHSDNSGFLLSSSTYTIISYPDSHATAPYGINDAGQIVGTYSFGIGSLGFLLSGGSYTTICYQGNTTSVVSQK